ncbi:hypothetical protein LTR56_021033 [Elasticomyces elasticus]|nr:hypothetical protein LTR56_021033 [Elasticomyces elasticus]KAK3646933.1 hypothetical protein LTR22_014086 [Elasticomyces elasticus]KAK4909894.1 hypothetical protein LTR49_021379 [Elasticomyces elasticus]KAK5750353.1 hypothetical protein LTS12_019614 [Elasticomyces elasticus]
MADLPPLIAYETLLWLGLNHERANQIWERWEQITPIEDDNPHYDNESLGLFAKDFLRNLVKYEEGCDIYGDVDWTPNLRQIGANEDLIDAIVNSEYRSIQLSQSGLDWVLQAMEWRWEYLVHVYKAQRDEEGSEDSDGEHGSHAELGDVSRTPLTAAARAQFENAASAAEESHGRRTIPSRHPDRPGEDTTAFSYDCETNPALDAAGRPLDYIPLWRATSRITAEGMWRTGKFKLSKLSTMSLDFSGRQAVHSWKLDLEAAQMYALFAQRLARPAEICLVRFELPLELVTEVPTMILRWSEEDWKRIVYHSRRRDHLPKDLRMRVRAAHWIIGDTASGPHVKYEKMKDWTEVDEKCVLRLRSGRPVTQFVFDHADNYGLEEKLEELGNGWVSIRDAERPSKILPPWGM